MYTLRKLALATLFIAVRWSDTAPPSSVQLERSVQKNGMTTNVSSSVEALWNEFKLQSDTLSAISSDVLTERFYNDEEEMLRRTIFAENVKAVERHNVLHRKGLRSFKLAINRFADVELSEFAKKFTGYRQQRITTGTERLPLASNLSSNVDKLVDLPHAIDWRLHGLVTPVKDQGDCGSCWAFSATGALEGQQYRKTGKLVALSEQNLVDCSWDFDNRGCEGGTMDGAFQYIMMNKGIDTESSYPYEAQNGQCRYTVYSVGAKDSGFVNVAGGDERKLMETVVTVGPVSAAVDASHPSFRFYHSGVYNEPRCSSVNPNHAVLVVGYGQENGNNYWLVKNSWGESWGESGYMKMSRNGSNQCGIASIASYPRV